MKYQPTTAHGGTHLGLSKGSGSFRPRPGEVPAYYCSWRDSLGLVEGVWFVSSEAG